MTVVLIILSAGLLALIIYFAFSPKSERLLKLAAFIALGLIAIAIGVCVFFLILGPSQDEGEILLPIFLDTPTEQPPQGNVTEILVFLVILLFIMALIIIIVRRDHKKKLEMAKKSKGPPAVKDDKTLREMALESASLDDTGDDESFDMGFD